MSNTRYSKWLEGGAANWDWPVRFDKVGQCIGISQRGDDGVTERVLMTRKQAQALAAFMGYVPKPKAKP